MTQKDYFEDKWLKDQYNEKNPGQANDPEKVSPPKQKPAVPEKERAPEEKKK